MCCTVQCTLHGEFSCDNWRASVLYVTSARNVAHCWIGRETRLSVWVAGNMCEALRASSSRQGSGSCAEIGFLGSTLPVSCLCLWALWGVPPPRCLPTLVRIQDDPRLAPKVSAPRPLEGRWRSGFFFLSLMGDHLFCPWASTCNYIRQGANSV